VGLKRSDLEVGDVWFLGDDSHVSGGSSIMALGTRLDVWKRMVPFTQSMVGNSYLENSWKNLNLLTPQNFPEKVENRGLCTTSWNWSWLLHPNVGLVLQHVLSSWLLGK